MKNTQFSPSITYYKKCSLGGKNPSPETCFFKVKHLLLDESKREVYSVTEYQCHSLVFAFCFERVGYRVSSVEMFL